MSVPTADPSDPCRCFSLSARDPHADSASPVGVEHGLRRLTVWVLITMVSGCSLALSGPNPERPANAPPRCDTGKGLVGLDGVIGGGFAIASLSALGAEEPGAAAITALVAAAFIASAARGNGLVNDCREAFAQYEPPPRPELAEREQLPEDPYAAPKPVRPRPVEWAPNAAPRPTQPQAPTAGPSITQPPQVAQPPARPAKPAPAAAAADEDWADFWTEVP